MIHSSRRVIHISRSESNRLPFRPPKDDNEYIYIYIYILEQMEVNQEWVSITVERIKQRKVPSKL